jgi:CHAD domain-containing protein
MALEKVHPPGDSSPAIKQFIETKKVLRQRARKELKTVVAKRRLKQLETDFLAAIEQATATSKGKPAAPAKQLTFLKMSHTIVIERLKELETLSADLFSPFEVKALHEMRIAAKRLRYALELFQPCWGRAFGTYAKRVAKIQSALGDVHDCDVWIEELSNKINAARKNKQHEEVAAFVWLLNHFFKLRTKHLRQAFSRWSDWEAQDVSAKLRATH